VQGENLLNNTTVGRVMLPVLVRILSPSLETMIVFCAPRSMPMLAILFSARCFWNTAPQATLKSSTDTQTEEMGNQPRGLLSSLGAESGNGDITDVYGPDPTLREPTRAVAFEPPRFRPDDPEIASYLAEHGYAVVSGVANPKEIDEAAKLFWNYLENESGMMRVDPSTWTDENFSKIGSTRSGIIFYRGIQHSDVLWFARSLPKVKSAFQQVYGTDDLITSYDGANIFRPWHLKDSDTYSKTHSGWYHVDQGRLLLGFQCVQGLVTLKDVNAATGGFCCVPGSHLYHDQVLETDLSHNPQRNYIPIPQDFRPTGAELPLREILVVCQAGDLILWDSRTIHCNTPALTDPVTPPTPPPPLQSDALLRMVCYVCMTPTAKASEEILRQRVQLFEHAIGTNHWPHHFNGMNVESALEGKTRTKDFSALPLHQRALISGERPPP
jgi:hypothetical protein